MAKPKQNPKPSQSEEAADPWDDEPEGDPWDDEAEETAQAEPDVVVPSREELGRMFSEEAQMRQTPDAKGRQWPVKWNYGNRPMTKQEVIACKKREKFLVVLSKTGSAKRAAEVVNLTQRALYKARQQFPDFDKNWSMAVEVYHMFEAEEKLRQRAIDGTLEPIVFQGRVTGYKRVYSDGLTQFWYKNNMRDKYGDKTEVNINGNINHGVMLMPAKTIDLKAWEAQAQQTLQDQTQKMIDITPKAEEVKPVKAVTPATRIDR